MQHDTFIMRSTYSAAAVRNLKKKEQKKYFDIAINFHETGGLKLPTEHFTCLITIWVLLTDLGCGSQLFVESFSTYYHGGFPF